MLVTSSLTSQRKFAPFQLLEVPDPQKLLRLQTEHINRQGNFHNLQSFPQMQRNLKMSSPWHLLLILATIFCGLPTDWQSYGNFTSAQLLAITDAINPILLAGTSTNYATDISTALTAQMESTWYVAYIYKPNLADQAYDSVCYGYAFRSHWLWYNNFAGYPGVTIILWKDYNCVTPTSGVITDLRTSVKSDNINFGGNPPQSYINFYENSPRDNYVHNPWLLIHGLVQAAGPSSGAPTVAYSGINVQGDFSTQSTNIILHYSLCYDTFLGEDQMSVETNEYRYHYYWIIWQTRGGPQPQGQYQ